MLQYVGSVGDRVILLKFYASLPTLVRRLITDFVWRLYNNKKMADRSTFEKMMDEYKSNYVQFVTTGNDAYKVAYKNAQDAIDKMLTARQTEVASQKDDMQKFVQSYQTGNDEMGEEYDKAAELHTNAQKIADEYDAAKNRYDLYTENSPKLPTFDISNGYAMILRFGIVLILIPIMFLVAFWSPQMNPFASSALRPGQPFEMNITSPMLSPMGRRL